MNLDLIDTFLDLLETGNFRRTSERLETTQPAVSGRIKTLERAVGAQLFHRGKMGTVPTPSGIRFEKHARALKASWAHARHDIGGLEQHDGPLRVSAQFGLTGTLLLDWIGEIRATNKRLALHLEASHSTQIVADVADGKADIGLMCAPQNLPDLNIEEIGAARLVMISTEFEYLAEVTPEKYIQATYSTYIERIHSEVLPHLTQSAITVGHEELAVGFIRRCGGTTYLPEHILGALADSGVSARRVKGAPEIQQPVYVVTQRRRKHDPFVNLAIRALRTVVQRDCIDTARRETPTDN
ncbi:LysR family transcriptional regulator [Ensifer adhaerens]|uniref:LysR family transcriptional regulator n=1 Tax=Ensifer canadensis TaxID=555315 RepID=UPI00148FF8E0|nr:LysR family transcriptional regulator [Ensifer canadensis]NOV20206.1 LysR family transcriptional regulator [Ensifer canadensis]